MRWVRARVRGLVICHSSRQSPTTTMSSQTKFEARKKKWRPEKALGWGAEDDDPPVHPGPGRGAGAGRGRRLNNILPPGIPSIPVPVPVPGLGDPPGPPEPVGREPSGGRGGTTVSAMPPGGCVAGRKRASGSPPACAWGSPGGRCSGTRRGTGCRRCYRRPPRRGAGAPSSSFSLSSVASLMTAGLGGARLVAPGHLGSDPQPCAGTGSAASAGRAAAIAPGNSGMS